MSDYRLPIQFGHLERSFRELLAADQARELLRQEAAVFVLLCLYAPEDRDHESRQPAQVDAVRAVVHSVGIFRSEESEIGHGTPAST